MTGLAVMIPDDLLLLYAQAAKAPGGSEAFLRTMVPILLVGVLFYFMLIRPESRKKADHAKLVENLKKHDRIVTIGGIFGSVSNVQKGTGEITVLIDENTNTKIRIQRNSISRVITENESGE
jgi:preprotein translocase subunit YajC